MADPGFCRGGGANHKVGAGRFYPIVAKNCMKIKIGPGGPSCLPLEPPMVIFNLKKTWYLPFLNYWQNNNSSVILKVQLQLHIVMVMDMW